MINRPVIITNNYESFKIADNYKNENIIFSLNIESIDDLNDYSSSLINNNIINSYNISLHFDLTKHIISPSLSYETILNQKNILLNYFFSPNYIISQGKPIIFFSYENLQIQQAKKIISGLDQFAISQGYEGIEAIYFLRDNYNMQNSFGVYLALEQSPIELSNNYFELLSDRFYVQGFIGIKTTEIEKSLEALITAENKLSVEKLLQHILLQHYSQLKQAILIMGEELKNTKTDLINQKIYLRFYKDKDEALRINEYYQKEYEILPLWYKRIGHIIKVLLGKRNFYSLFNSNIKKYKD